MTGRFVYVLCQHLRAVALLGMSGFLAFPALANPSGGKVAKGSASFSSSGSQLTITTSDRAFINWQSFNIGVGETTTFIQPSSSSLVWNQINGGNPSQILGNLNANGYVVLQNQSGFFVGGQASISAHGLIMTTTPIPMPDLSSGSAWSFDAPPPLAKIVNYGQISANGGSVFLIAHDVENNGTISAPGGNIGLYAGKHVLVSERPDGRGLSAKITLPDGSVNNQGQLIADAGTIAMRAQVVNQGGLVQANSVREVNGTIELIASDAVNLGAGSVISAAGDSQGTSSGGSVTIKSDGSFVDQPTSVISVAGGAQGGNGGEVEVSAPHMNAIHSRIDGHAASGWTGGHLFIDPASIYLVDGGDTVDTGTVNAGDDDLVIDPNASFSGFSQILLSASKDIELSTKWILQDQSIPSSLTLEAAENITLDDGSAIIAGRNWSVNLIAGTELTSAARKQAGLDGIYLYGMAFIQAQNGNISLTAGNNIFLDDGGLSGDPLSSSPYDPGEPFGNGVTTAAGGSITVNARFGNVNTGGNPYAYTYSSTAPYYSVSTAPGALGGISTAAGGNVSITAGGNVTSYLPLAGLLGQADGGSGAFGPEPGDVTVKAGGNVLGHFVVANGTGTIQAGQNAGSAVIRAGFGFALSLIKGSWNVYAPNGNIYLQEVRNPNGVFNQQGGAGNLLFDYDPLASVLLEAGNSVVLQGSGLPRGADVKNTAYQAGVSAPQIIYPPSLDIIAGAGGVTLGNDVTLFPSPYGELNVSTTGNFIGQTLNGNRPTLYMSDSGNNRWVDSTSFTPNGTDHSSTPPELNNPNPATISVAGNMQNLIVATDKRTEIAVGGNMINAGFEGENLHANDVTSVTVAGQIFNRSLYTFVTLTTSIIGADPLNPAQWDTIFNLAVDPRLINSTPVSSGDSAAELQRIANTMLLFASGGSAHNPGFVYDPSTLQFGYSGQMSAATRDALDGTKGALEIIKLGPDGLPSIGKGDPLKGQDPLKYYFQTTPVTFVPNSVIDKLYAGSQDVPTGSDIVGYRIGGPGQLNITAGSIDLGTTAGIQSMGVDNYPWLANLTPAGAAINVTTLAGDLSMVSSRISSELGGDITVNCAGSMDLGKQGLFGSSGDAFGIWTSGHSSIFVTAVGDININGSRIAAYNGGNIFVESLQGDINAGSGGTVYVSVPVIVFDPVTGAPSRKTAFIYGSGIVTTSLTKNLQTPGGNPLPGNITVETPQGDIVSTTAGILQLPLDGNLGPGPVITLVAGTAPSDSSPGFAGNIDLGASGVIGGAINLTAQGDIKGLVISRQNSTINAAQNFSGTVLSAGSANISAGGNVSGTIIGITGVNASGGAGVSATLLSQNVTVGGGQAQSTLGTTANATATSQSAAQASTTDTKQATANNTGDDDDTKKRNRPKLTKRSRVTVILPKT